MTRETIIIDVLRTWHISDDFVVCMAVEICEALDLPGKVNWASYMHDAAFGKMDYGRDRWLGCERPRRNSYAESEYWAEYWQDGMKKQRYYFQRRAMLMNIDEARLP